MIQRNICSPSSFRNKKNRSSSKIYLEFIKHDVNFIEHDKLMLPILDYLYWVELGSGGKVRVTPSIPSYITDRVYSILLCVYCYENKWGLSGGQRWGKISSFFDNGAVPGGNEVAKWDPSAAPPSPLTTCSCRRCLTLVHLSPGHHQESIHTW